MPDPWLSEEELEEHNKEVENHPLTQQANDAAEAAEKDAEELRKRQEEDRKAVEAGEKVPVYANGAVVGYRDADQVDPVEQAFAEGVKPKEEGAGQDPVTGDTNVGALGDEDVPAEAKVDEGNGKKGSKK